MKLIVGAGALLGASLLFGAGGSLSAAPAPTGDPASGNVIFARCAACHDLNTGSNRLGPTLKGVIGRKAGTAVGYTYSPALKAKGVVWSPASLDTFLAAPTRYAPGNKMAFAGLPNAKDRADLIAYLRQAAR